MSSFTDFLLYVSPALFVTFHSGIILVASACFPSVSCSCFLVLFISVLLYMRVINTLIYFVLMFWGNVPKGTNL